MTNLREEIVEAIKGYSADFHAGMIDPLNYTAKIEKALTALESSIEARKNDEFRAAVERYRDADVASASSQKEKDVNLGREMAIGYFLSLISTKKLPEL